MEIDVAGAVTGSGTLDAAVDNQGTITAENGRLIITGAVSDTGALDVGPSGTLELEQGVASTQSVTFEDATGNLVLDDLADFHATVHGFRAGDAITLQGITVGSSTYIDNKLTIYDPSHVLLGTIAFADDSLVTMSVPPGPPPVVITTTDSPPCFLRGTRILTDQGEVAVEALRPGDLVALAAGGFRAVTWIGHRRLDAAAHPAPETVLPIRVGRDAFGPGRPAQDVWLSPAHAVFAEGALIPIDRLVNGATVARDAGITRPHYFHVELDAHDVILAEGLSVESYLDTGNRSTFENGGVPMMLHPDLVPPTRDAGCAPFHTTGPTVARVRQALLDRAAALGFAMVANDERIALRAGERLIRPVARTGNDLHFVLPPGARDIRLLSGAAVPAETSAESEDRRRVGVGVTRIAIRGEAGLHEIAVDDPALADGWYEPEGNGPVLWRWTDGNAALPVEGPGVLKIVVIDSLPHWEKAVGGEALVESRSQRLA